MSAIKKEVKRITTKSVIEMKAKGEKIAMLTAYDYTFALEIIEMVVLAQLVRASDCGSEGRGFEPHIPP